MTLGYDVLRVHPAGIWYEKMDQRVWCSRSYIVRITFMKESIAICMHDEVTIWLKVMPDEIAYFCEYFRTYDWPEFSEINVEDVEDGIPF